MYSEIVGGGLSALNRAGDLLRRGAGSDSLVDFTSAGRVEPVVLIEQPAMHLECIGEVQQSLLAIFAGYYLQAASLMNSMGNVRVIDRLESLNPNRSPVNAGLSTWMIATEAYENGLPFPNDLKRKALVESGKAFVLSQEAIGMGSLGGSSGNGGAAPGLSTGEGKSGGGGESHGNTEGAMGGMGVAGKKDDPRYSGKPGSKGAGAGGKIEPLSKADIGRTMTELANLSVGKTYEITITDGDKSIPVLINIRLIASTLPTQDLIHILATGSEDNSFKERWHGWKSGRLSFWKDLVFCGDLIDKHRKDLMKDKSGTLTQIRRQDLGNKVSSLISGNPTIASATNMVVITKDTAEALELQLEGKLSNFQIRERMFEKTALMILVIVDEVDYKNVTFYTRHIPQPSTIRIKDLKASNKGDGPNIGEILKQLMGGHAPSL